MLSLGCSVRFLEGAGPEATARTNGKGLNPVLTSFFFQTMERKFLHHKPFLVPLLVKGHPVFELKTLSS